MKSRNPICGLSAAVVLQLGVLGGSAQTNQYLFSGSERNIILNPGTYDIAAFGAQGGGGGLGAEMEATFYFPTSTTLTLLVGGAGSGGYGGSGGGGGGSFVVKGNTPLLIAGGGGAGGSGVTNSAGGYNGGSGGNGGAGGGGGGGGGGGSFYSGGGSGGGPAWGGGITGSGAAGGSSYLSGGAGGVGGFVHYQPPPHEPGEYAGGGGPGGYGGGGGGGVVAIAGYGPAAGGGGGGGGYSGGSGGGGGGGGGSFIDSSAIAIGTELAGVQSGNGEIDIVAVMSIFVSQPGSRTNDPGTTATFSVLAGSSAPLSYQWRKDGAPLVDGGKIAGSGTALLTLTNVLGADAGGYSVVVSNGFGSLTSAVATLVVIDPLIAFQPVSRTCQRGNSVTLSVTAVGTAPFGYQWWHHGAALASATGSSLTLTNLQAADAGDYWVVVNNQYGSATSAVALLTVNLASLDSGFNPRLGGVPGYVNSLAVQADGKILVGGWFTPLGGQTPISLCRLNADGTLDSAFNPGANYSLVSLAVQTDGKILVGGQFGTLGGQGRNYIGRLNADGTLDTGFNPGANNTVDCLALQADGKILVGGYFTTLAGHPRTYLGRLNADGTLDSGFNPGLNQYGYVYLLAVQPDGKILVGGGFDTLDGQPCDGIGRLNADGSLDTSFNPQAGPWSGYRADSLALQADGKILVGGDFIALGGPCNCSWLGRLNADGTLDSAFNPGANNHVLSLAVQADGKILVGGWFTTLGGQTRNYLGRLNADGTLDSGFDPGADSGINSLAVQADGKILVSGNFSSLAGQPCNGFGRLNNTEPATQSLSFDGSTITWLRGGASPEVWRTTFDFSTDGTNWASLGAGARIAGLPAGQAGGWQLTSVSLPSANGTIRARGYVTACQYDGCSTWFVESDLQVLSAVSPPPVILVNDPRFGFISSRFGFRLSGTAGQVVIVETSTNLATWTPAATNTLAATPSNFSDAYSGNFPQRFYRLRCITP